MVWGGWPGHSPKQCTELFAPWLESQKYSVTISDSLDIYLDTNLLDSMDLIIPIWTQGILHEKHTSNLLEAIANGTGIAGWHGCMGDSFRENVNYQFMVGGQWVAHPGGIIKYKVKILSPSDPIMHGLTDFEVFSEQYYMHVDPSNEVLATTSFSGKENISKIAPYNSPWIHGCEMPVIWKRHWGRGKVFYSSIGHKPDDFEIPEVLEITKRGLLWASR
ncbi:MAG: hypothetical protein CL735_00870 [Chloroflexi bacterium]|nr:hypothetical protein [Chloroflexota bacterium]